MTKDDCFLLGYVEKTHGIHGEIVMVFDVDFPEDYEDLESIFLEVKGRLVPYFIESLRLRGNKAIVQLEDVNTVEKAALLKSCELYLPEEALEPLDEDQFYFHEIIGYQVIDKLKGVLGKVTAVYELPQQHLLAMDYQDVEVLIPLTDAIVLAVDKENAQVQTQLPDGLLEIYLEEKPNREN
ncbi:16S rRNA processing protein RimM [Flexibacter flexilis DSM 6793]|uniref:Ribosome maturation factor RimM n=1 Tax=Flexibacter flexilis DSM 6793 TaxID=927664 RepID=A0A1I1L379_9BACT|nr:ribosome maturation factor RimM [Flexibacter flexilis]SFC67499.1 16S rRNA processing protein RimM [Flexibacter flexilis DSM 6793]